MDEHRDEVDAWLSQRVQPLLPRPGAFDRIHREARRRRSRRAALIAASAAAVVVAGAVAVPTLAGVTLFGAPPAAGPVAASHPSLTPLTSPSPATGTSAAPAGPAPADFAPESVTFVGSDTGYVLGRAGAASPCSPSPATVCLARTDNQGKTWSLVNPPPTGGPDSGTGVSQVRFLNDSDGWAFGPQLWATHDGGRSWTRIATGGMRVTALETRNDQAFAVLARCTGRGSDFAAGCHTFTLWSATAGSDTWTQVPGVTAQKVPGGAGGSAQLLLTATQAYLLAPDGFLFAGTYGATGTWQEVKRVPCSPGPPQADGQPSRAMLASNAADLLVLCAPSGVHSATLYTSSDGGLAWALTGSPPVSGPPTSLSGSPSGSEVVLATAGGIEISADRGVSWSSAGGTAPRGGFSYAGMTTDQQGVAVPADAGQHALWFTYDGGATWRGVPLG